MILDSLSVVKSDEFQGISVSSDIWLPMSEVSVKDLPHYLRTMKQRGYTIVGIEQTDSSISLEDFHIPECSVLLLGKEREGIPVHLLQEVDICVEIPQFGVIRSLNVHVSAALAIWEATKSNLLHGERIK